MKKRAILKSLRLLIIARGCDIRVQTKRIDEAMARIADLEAGLVALSKLAPMHQMGYHDADGLYEEGGFYDDEKATYEVVPSPSVTTTTAWNTCPRCGHLHPAGRRCECPPDLSLHDAYMASVDCRCALCGQRIAAGEMHVCEEAT